MTITFTCLIIAALTLWIPLIVYGIYKVIRKEKKTGTYLIVAGSAWCVIAFTAFILTAAYLTYSTFNRINTSYKTADFKPDQYQGEIGEMLLSYGKIATITAYDSKNHKSIKSSGTDGKIKFPVGKFSFSNLSITEKDSTGKTWTLSVPLYRKYSNVTVSKNKPVEIKVTPPFIAEVKSSNQFGKDVFDFELKDGDGNSVSISDGSRSKPPKFQLVDSAGTVVFEKNFEYG
jgi:hypothetical protein